MIKRNFFPNPLLQVMMLPSAKCHPYAPVPSLPSTCSHSHSPIPMLPSPCSIPNTSIPMLPSPHSSPQCHHFDITISMKPLYYSLTIFLLKLEERKKWQDEFQHDRKTSEKKIQNSHQQKRKYYMNSKE